MRRRVATWRDVRDRLGNPSSAIVDTRSDAEYYGEAVRAKRGGAIPGAVHLEWKQNLDKDGRYKPVAELRAMYEEPGSRPTGKSSPTARAATGPRTRMSR